jgi:hypothetical protein
MAGGPWPPGHPDNPAKQPHTPDASNCEMATSGRTDPDAWCYACDPTGQGDFLAKQPTDPRRPVEAVNHPDHYGGDTVYEVIKVLEAWGLDNDAYLFNVVKYVARAGKKDPAKTKQDLEKARFYLDRRINML